MIIKILSLESIKNYCINFLEKHPIGYLLGAQIVKLILSLPHEIDYYGFRVLQERGLAGKKVILDIGGNQGHSSRGFLKILKDYEVISFEALALHQKSLHKIKLRFKEKFTYYINAVGNDSTQCIEFFMPYYYGFSLHSAAATELENVNIIYEMWPKLKNNNSIIIRKYTSNMIRIDDLNLNFNMMKIDIQGGEYEALLGMEKSIAINQPIILIETQIGVNNIDQLLKQYGYAPYIYNPSSREFYSGASHIGRNTFYIPLCHMSLVNKNE